MSFFSLPKIFFSDIQIKTFLKIIFFSIIVLMIYLSMSDSQNLSLRAIFFNVISILTGTGYVNAQFDNWGGFSLILFLRAGDVSWEIVDMLQI